LLILILGAIVWAIFYFESINPRKISLEEVLVMPPDRMGVEEKAELYPLAREISSPHGYINTEAISIEEYIGKKVILVDFWTYSCINCQRTFPYLNAWWEKYEDKGLVMIGIHTPEFAFENILSNVVAAVEKYEIKYPVVLDNDYATWNAYANRYWPAKYIIDIDGFIVYQHFGEGQYKETEEKIQELLAERKMVLAEEETKIFKTLVEPKGVAVVDRRSVGSPEVYFGAFRNEILANGKQSTIGNQSFTAPNEIQLNKLYLDGQWKIEREFAENMNAGARIIFGYQARVVNFVAEAPFGAKVKIFQDGVLVKELEIKDAALYELIADQDYGQHIIEILIEDPGLQAFTFTFG